MTIKEKDFDRRRLLPSVDKVLRHSGLLIQKWGRIRVTDCLRNELTRIRALPINDFRQEVTLDEIIKIVENRLLMSDESSFRRIINLSGIVLHTNLGRALLPKKAIEAVVSVASCPTNLEYDLKSGGRGERDHHVEQLICELTGVEAATVVNNNAAALLLVLNTLADQKEVPVSRGELVEIGGAFRIPDIMIRSGCKLVEIGTTNRTHLCDYESTINHRTALLLKVHTCNFRVEGFTAAVEENKLSVLAKQNGIPLVVDLGSGNLIDMDKLGLPREPIVSKAVTDGADIITFSGDKLLGGPQCGIISGRRDLINRIRKNPLKRALRPDKMIYAALAEVLKLYRNPCELEKELPTIRFLKRSVVEIEAQAKRLVPQLSAVLPDDYSVSADICNSQIGSGALPVENIPSYGLIVSAVNDARLIQLLNAFRKLPCPVVGRLSKGKLILDIRCMELETQFSTQLSELADLLK